MSVLRPQASGLFYIRVEDTSMTYGAKLRLLGIESALNALVFADELLPDPNAATLAELLALRQRTLASISRIELESSDAPGEWAARQHLSYLLESLRLPYRLSCEYRMNLELGEAAAMIVLPPANLFPRTVAGDNGAVVPASADMRRRAEADYAARLALLVARALLACSPEVERAWVSCVLDEPEGVVCLVSGNICRAELELMEASDSADPVALLAEHAMRIRSKGGALESVEEAFSLEERRFCPEGRNVAPELSIRDLPDDAARALGAEHVRDLGIDARRGCADLAPAIMFGLGPSTAENVEWILSLTKDNADALVRRSGERTVRKLIEGSLEDSPLLIADEFAVGDDFRQAAERSRDLVSSGRMDEAAALLEPVLSQASAEGLYVDADGVVWRSFGSFAERILYNRTLAEPGVRTELVDAPYRACLLNYAAALLALGRTEDALATARRLHEISPFSAQAAAMHASCLEMSGQPEEAKRTLSDMLRRACDRDALSGLYYQLSLVLWRQGRMLSAQACHQMALTFLPPAAAAAFAEMRRSFIMATLGTAPEELSETHVKRLLAQEDIPIAPADETREIIIEAARAALDAQVFPVARELLGQLASMSHDDILLSMMRSLGSGAATNASSWR